MRSVKVVQRSGEKNHRLKIEFELDRCGTIVFHTPPEFSKQEADFRVMMLSVQYGLERDKLPTHLETS